MIFCPYCGNKIPQGTARCPRCNSALEAADGAAPDMRGSTLMGVASVKDKDAAPARAPRSEGPSSSIVVDQRLQSPAAPAEAAATLVNPSQAPQPEAPKFQTPLSLPKLSQASAEARESKTSTGEMPAARTSPPSARADWEGPADPRLQKENLGDSLVMRAGDIIDPVTGVPLRAFQPKRSSRIPLLLLGVMLVSVIALIAYTYTRPEPPAKLSVKGQSPAPDGATYSLTVDVGGSFSDGTSLKVNGISAKVEENLAVLALPDGAVPVGPSELSGEVTVAEGTKPVIIPVTRIARTKYKADAAQETLTIDFEVAPNGTAVSMFDKEAKVANGKASLTLSFRAAVNAADPKQGMVEKMLPFAIAGLEGEGEAPVKFPAPKPPLTVSKPTEPQTVVDKKTDSIEVVFSAIPGAAVTVSANKSAVVPKDGKFLIPLKADSETVIEIKAEGKEFSAVTETRRVFRGTPPADWLNAAPKAP